MRSAGPLFALLVLLVTGACTVIADVDYDPPPDDDPLLGSELDGAAGVGGGDGG